MISNLIKMIVPSPYCGKCRPTTHNIIISANKNTNRSKQAKKSNIINHVVFLKIIWEKIKTRKFIFTKFGLLSTQIRSKICKWCIFLIACVIWAIILIIFGINWFFFNYGVLSPRPFWGVFLRRILPIWTPPPSPHVAEKELLT